MQTEKSAILGSVIPQIRHRRLIKNGGLMQFLPQNPQKGDFCPQKWWPIRILK